MKLLKIMGLMLFALNAQAATYFVSKTGNDANVGTISQPFLTIGHALDTAWTAGDKIFVRGGTYNETIAINQDNITLSSWNEESVIIDTAGKDAEWLAGIAVNGSYNAINGLEVKNVNLGGANQGGYGMQVYGHNNAITKIKAHHNWGAGIIVNGDYNTVSDSIAYLNSIRNQNGDIPVGWGTGISAARNEDPNALHPGITSYATFKNNKTYNNYGEGISCFEADHCVMDQNISYDNWTVNVYLSDATNSIVSRSLAYRSTGSTFLFRPGSNPGIVLADEVSNGTTIPHSSNNLVADNCVFGQEFQVFAYSIQPVGLVNSNVTHNTIIDGAFLSGNIGNSNSSIKNNIIVDGSGLASEVTSNVGLTFANNNWQFGAPALANVASNVNGNPMLTRTGGTTAGALTKNYCRIASNSPDINTGAALTSPGYDLFYAAFPAQRDIGAHEYGATALTPTVNTKSVTVIPGGIVSANWSTTKLATGRVEYGTSSTSFPWYDTAATTALNQNKARGGLVAGTTYYWRIVTTDTYTGVTATSAVSSFVAQ